MTSRRILVVGWLLFLLYAYPGFITSEGIDELIDSRVGMFTDWHSPVMTEVWRIVGFFVSGPPGMLMVQSLLLLGGAYSLLRRGISDRHAAIAACVVLWFPPITATMGVVCHESQMAGFLAAGAAALWSERPRVRVFGLVLVALGIGMRAGAAWASMPVVIGFFELRGVRRGWVRYGIALAVWLALVGAMTVVERTLIDLHSDRQELTLAQVDIAGTAKYDASVDASDSALAKVSLVETLPPDQVAEIENARRRMITDHTGAYVRHRWHVFWRVLGFSMGKAWKPVDVAFTEHRSDGEAARYTASHSLVQTLLEWPVRVAGHTALFRPFVYFVVSIVLLPLAVLRRQRIAIALLASGLAYELSLMFVTPSAEFRFSHWMIVAAVIAAASIVVDRVSEARHKRVGEQAQVGVT